jgi:hypothetical protein
MCTQPPVFTCCPNQAPPEEQRCSKWILTSDHGMQPLESHGNVINAVLDLNTRT